MEGQFENVVNKVSAPSQIMDTVATIMGLVSNVAQSWGFSAESGGSIKKHTYVHGYSDLDIIVNNTGKEMTKKNRTEFAMDIKRALSREYTMVTHMHKYQATTFTCHQIRGPELSFDLVFASNTWSAPLKFPVKDFHGRSDRQKAVCGLKVLSFLVRNILVYKFIMPTIYYLRSLLSYRTETTSRGLKDTI